MTELLNAAQMRAIEAAAIASGEVTGLELMERAGRGVVEAVWEEWPELKAKACVFVLCGPGNNGGDGFVVARLLKESGWEVEVFLWGMPAQMPPDARVNYERWRAMGEVKPFDEKQFPPKRTTERGQLNQYFPDLYIDAMFGTGLTREFSGGYPMSFLGYENGGGRIHEKVVAIDCVSGLDLDSGLFLGWPNTPFDNDFRRAALTVTFHRAKRGHFLAAGPIASGKLVVKGLGFKRSVAHYLPEIQTLGDRWSEFVILQPDDFIGNAEPNAPVSEFLLEDLTKGRIWRERPNKYHFGHAFILSGPSGQGGAARLSARGALRIGAGLVTVGCPPEAIPENAAQLNAIMLKPIGDAAALTEAMQDKRITALCLGPGMEVDWAAELLSVALASRGLHPLYLVLDADALTALSRDPALFAQLHENCVLTPHAGEFGRLFPDIAEKLAAPATVGPAYSKVDATREAAKRAGCVVLFKGPDTVIADPTGRCSINSAHYERSAPWLATAGSGDVLAGFITGLLARGFQPMQAAETAAWLHVECARSFGPGLIAEDLPEELPKVFRALGL